MSDNLYKNYVKEERNSQKNIWTPYDNNESENSASEDDHHEDSPKGGKSKKKYSVISQAVREKFIKRVLSKEVTIKEAAKEFGLKFSTSKAILQTYKKEGRIGKKKNRERKTKVVNAVFIANINPNNSLLGSLPLGPLNELKNLNLPNVNDPNIAKNFDQNFGKLSDQKFAKGASSINGYNKVTQSIIKEFGNDFLRDFIEKNFSQARPQTLNSTPEASSSLPVNTNFGATNLTGMKHFINFGTSNTNKPSTAFNSVSSLGGSSVLMPQKVSSINSDIQPIGGLSIPNPKFLNASKADSFLSNQKRAFQQYERESMGDFGSRSDQINDISVKKFKSGEDLWDFDVDKSKKDLEDFIYKTHNIMKNNLNDL